MKLLFTLPGSETKESTVGDSNFQEHYPSVNRSMNWRAMKPYIRQATEDVIVYISAKFYDKIEADYSDPAPSIPEMLAIREKLQDAIAYRAIYKAAPHLNVTIADMGVQQTSSENATSQPVTQWRYKALRKEAISEYYSKLDQALYQMEQHIDEPYLADFKASDAYKAHTTAFFRTTAVLSKYINVQRSRRTYIAMLPHLRRAEKDLRAIMCGPAFEEMKAYKIDAPAPDPVTVEHKGFEHLVDMCRHYLANQALVLGVPRLRVLVEDDGIKVVTETDGFDSKNPANKDMIRDFISRAQEDAYTYQKEILAHLSMNLDVFTTYRDHGHTESRVPGVISSPGDVGGIGIF